MTPKLVKNISLLIVFAALLLPFMQLQAQEQADTTKTAADTTQPAADSTQPAADTTQADSTKPLPDFVPIPDRWNDIVPPPYELYVQGKGFNPYYQNVIKGDYPIWGQNTFLILTATLASEGEFAQSPTPSGVSTANPHSLTFFGEGQRFFMNHNAKFTFELYHGETAYRPRDWEIKVTPVFNLNYLNLRENNGVNINPRKGDNRTDHHIAFQELSVEKKLFDMTSRFDFMSFRAGIQKFSSDFRGLVFSDFNLGFRLFGNYAGNKYQYSFIYLPLLEKETNSELNTVFDNRHQEVFIANLYKQDFGVLGYTAEFSIHYNHDEASTHYDENGRPVRPMPVGFVKEHTIHSYYFGWAGDGHFGRINVSHAFYQVVGDDDFNQIAGRKVYINAQMGTLELSLDRDWMRFKISALYASGDTDPLDDRGKGFDAILDAPFFAGGPFSWWQQQGLGLPGVGLVHKFSFLPTLRTNKFEGQSNFVNPGLILLNAGYDAELTPKLKMILNVNYLRFADTRVLQHFLNQPGIGNHIGMDYSMGLVYRPFLNNNAIITMSFAALTPLAGFKDIYETDQTQFSSILNLVLTY